MFFCFFQAEDGIRDPLVTGVQTCALPISSLVTVLVAGTSGVVAGDAGAVGAGLDRDTCGEHLPDRGGRLSRCPAISVRSWLQMATPVALAGGCGGFSPRPHAELGQDVGHMELHGVLGDV